MIALVAALACALILGVAGWLLLRPRRETIVVPFQPRLVDSPMRNDDIETFRFKPTPTTDTVYIPRVGPGMNKHYVDLTAESPVITPQQIASDR